MQSISAVHVHMEGFTAFFKHPLTITGTQVSLPCPPYSTILGLISACVGKFVSHNDVRIGYEFRCRSTDVELERTERLAFDDKGDLRKHPEGQGILRRYVHFHPQLDLYLTNTELAQSFKCPISALCLGRSQDIMWITNVELVELTLVETGKIGPTMISYSSQTIPSLIVRCPEWFSNETKGFTRIVGPIGFYQAILPTSEERFKVTMPNLYHPTNFVSHEDVIYLHEWTRE